jgi:hypothetical protein
MYHILKTLKHALYQSIALLREALPTSNNVSHPTPQECLMATDGDQNSIVIFNYTGKS